MADWEDANLAAFVPSELTSVITAAGTTASAASGVINVIRGAIEAAKIFLIAFPPFDFLGALATQVEQFKEDFLASGLQALVLWDYPVTQFNRLGGAGSIAGEEFVVSFEQDVINAFNDELDPNRPPVSGQIGALLLVGAVPGLSGMLTLAQEVEGAFSWWDEISKVVDQLRRVDVESRVREVEDAIKNGDIKVDKNPSRATIFLLTLATAMQEAKNFIEPEAFETNIEPLTPSASSTLQEIQQFIDAIDEEVANAPYPNFESISLRKIIPQLQQALDEGLDPLIATLATGRSIVDVVDSLLDAIDAKIAILDNIVSIIDDILSQLDALLALTGLNALFVEGNSISDITSQIQAAGNKPLGGTTEAFYTGLVVVGSGANFTAFRNLFAPIAGV